MKNERFNELLERSFEEVEGLFLEGDSIVWKGGIIDEGLDRLGMIKHFLDILDIPCCKSQDHNRTTFPERFSSALCILKIQKETGILLFQLLEKELVIKSKNNQEIKLNGKDLFMFRKNSALETLAQRNKQYNPDQDDRLHNFREAGNMFGNIPEIGFSTLL